MKKLARSFTRHLKSNVVGYVALFIALGGVAYAGAKPLLDVKGSVDSANLKAGAVKGSDIAAGAISEGDLSGELQKGLGLDVPAPANGTYVGTGTATASGGSDQPVTVTSVWRNGAPVSARMTSPSPICTSASFTAIRPEGPISWFVYLDPRLSGITFDYLAKNAVMAEFGLNTASDGQQCTFNNIVVSLQPTG
ncbi:MAG TPA: hypothetical protein VFB52_14800 [Solirubrobacterales bacterium]|nr:hypothetical protein [Solirubrobacterales bacterium]